MVPSGRHHGSSVATTRREWLQRSGMGLGSLALADLLARQASAAVSGTLLHHPPRARRVIFLFMQGGQSQMDLFDPKPELRKRDGQTDPARKDRTLKGSPFRFAQYGASGMELSELQPHLASKADSLCLVRSMYTDSANHSNAVLCFHTGSQNFVRPSVGSWVLYGLGSGNESLPGFVTIRPTRGHGSRVYSNAFLPSRYQGVPLGHDGIAARDITINHLDNSQWSSEQQRLQREWLRQQNQEFLSQNHSDEVEGLIEAYEMAARMQLHAPDVLNIDQEPQHIHELYGVDASPTDEMARMCLLARRMSESGVRFVQINHAGWDHHGSIDRSIRGSCERVDRPVAALIHDLEQRGMLHDTLVVMSGEFGRTAVGEGKGDATGRGHNEKGFSIWMCGGGVRPGTTYGATDELGVEAIENRVHYHDLHATILHLLGLDHERLTFRYAGRDFRLTDVYGKVVHELIG